MISIPNGARRFALVAVYVLLLVRLLLSGSQSRQWDPSQAETDARRAIASGDLNIIYSGGFGVSPTGIPQSFKGVIRNLRMNIAGPGCSIADWSAYQAQLAYATIYNRLMVRHVLQQFGRSTDLLDRAIENDEDLKSPNLGTTVLKPRLS